jgi:hypothetical protein
MVGLLTRTQRRLLTVIFLLVVGWHLWIYSYEGSTATFKAEFASPSESLFGPPIPISSTSLETLRGRLISLKGACLPLSLRAHFSATDGNDARLACLFVPTESNEAFPLLVGTLSKGSIHPSDMENTFLALLEENVVIARVEHGLGSASASAALPPFDVILSEVSPEMRDRTSTTVLLKLIKWGAKE